MYENIHVLNILVYKFLWVPHKSYFNRKILSTTYDSNYCTCIAYYD